MRQLWWDMAWCWLDPLDQAKPRWALYLSRHCLQFYSQLSNVDNYFSFAVQSLVCVHYCVLVLWDPRWGNNSSEGPALCEWGCVWGGSDVCPQPQVYHHGTALRGVWLAHTWVVSDLLFYTNDRTNQTNSQTSTRHFFSTPTGRMVSSHLLSVEVQPPWTVRKSGTCLMGQWMLYGLRTWTLCWMTTKSCASALGKSSSSLT